MVSSNIDEPFSFSIVGNTVITGSLIVTGGITGSLSGSAGGSSVIASGSVSSGSLTTSLYNEIAEKILYLNAVGASSQYYSAPPNTMTGSDNFVVAWIMRPQSRHDSGGGDFLKSGNPGSGNGWSVALSFDALFVNVATPSGSTEINLNSINGGYWGGIGYKYQRDVVLLFQVFQDTNTKVALWANGGKMFTSTGPAPNVIGGTDNLTYLGRTTPCEAGHGGFAYKTGTVTDQEIRNFFEACYEERKLSTEGISWDHHWSVSNTTPDSTWVSTGGSVTLVRSGSQLPFVNPKTRWA